MPNEIKGCTSASCFVSANFFIYRRKSILDKDNYNYEKLKTRNHVTIFTSIILEIFLIYNSQYLS